MSTTKPRTWPSWRSNNAKKIAGLGDKLNRSEVFVSQLCTKSFLSLWGYPNPKGKDSGKELCDFLVVCDPDVIIFSVKEIGLKEAGDESFNWERWHRRAVEKSVKQIYGAEKFIRTSSAVTTKDRQKGLNFPDPSRMRVHRVAVALGGETGKGLVKYGDFGKGFTHTFDEISLRAVMSELDTITDFVGYLAAKEQFLRSGTQVIFSGDEDLLALYLSNNRQFPLEPTLIILDDDLWNTFARSSEYSMKKVADKDSYVWDWLIEGQSQDYRIAGASLYDRTFSLIGESDSLSSFEMTLRAMAREDRLCRRFLGQAFKEFATPSPNNRIRSRLVGSPSGVQYFFLKGRPSKNIELGLKELAARCFIARGLNPDYKTVVGIIEQELIGKGFNINFCYLHQEDWTEQDQVQMKHLQQELGFFSKPTKRELQIEDYPSS